MDLLGKQPVKDFEEQLKECRTEAQQAPGRTDQAGEETMDKEAEEKRDDKYKTILPEYNCWWLILNIGW